LLPLLPMALVYSTPWAVTWLMAWPMRPTPNIGSVA
jgi:hypothetical protein